MFDPYAETDFRTPTNQLEFENTASAYEPGAFAAALLSRSPASPRESFAMSQRYSDGGHLTRDSSYSAAETMVGAAEEKKTEVEPEYGEKV